MHTSTIYRAYCLLRARTQFETVMLSDLFAALELGELPARQHEQAKARFLRAVEQLHGQGLVVLSIGDWSLASRTNREFVITGRTQGGLADRWIQVRFHLPQTSYLTTRKHSALVTPVSNEITTTKNQTMKTPKATTTSNTTAPTVVEFGEGVQQPGQPAPKPAKAKATKDQGKLPKGAKQTKEIQKVKAGKGAAKVKQATAKAKPAKKEPRLDTGFVAAIRTALNTGKYTISEMAAEVQEQFPDKDLNSIKRIGHNLAKKARTTDPATKAKWQPGAPASTGYMARIDELLRAGKLTTRQIGEKVAVEFPKDGVEEADRIVSAKKVIRARLKRLKGAGEKFNVPLESAIREAKPKVEKAAKPAAKVKATPKAAKESAGAKAERLVKEAGKAKKSAKK